MASNDNKKPSGDQVGYGKPPAPTRFQKGQSGNPKGRPKGSLNLATVLTRTLQERVIINENGQRKTVTKLEAAAKQLVNRAASGDLGAVRHLLMLVQSVQERSNEAAPPVAALDDADQKIVTGMLKRFDESRKGGQEE